MGLVALTNISHAKNNLPFWIEAGSNVKESDFSEEQWAQLKVDGAIGVPPAKAEEVADENERLRKSIKELQAQLAASKRPATPPAK
jgi:hypothetical protein